MDRLVIRDEVEPLRVTLILRGELDIATVPELERAIEEIAAWPAPDVVLDLRELTFMDAAGLHAIETAARRLKLVVCGPRPPVRKLIELTRLDDVVQVRAGGRPEDSDVPASNLAYVSQLFDAFSRGGVEEFAALVPDDVKWRSFWAGGRTLHGTQELLRFWSTRPTPRLRADAFTSVRDDVLVTWQLETEAPKDMWSLYRFRGRRLVEAATFDRETEAIAALQLSRTA